MHKHSPSRPPRLTDELNGRWHPGVPEVNSSRVQHWHSKVLDSIIEVAGGLRGGVDDMRHSTRLKQRPIAGDLVTAQEQRGEAVPCVHNSCQRAARCESPASEVAQAGGVFPHGIR
eukprot:CAMPEP_0177766894 /NCGR_PEP_ID=MMETSP0491_2-20121128/8770_1 /TAXON_ID=63592 /ORGANISM="Tetraselmis chuii, Strain PLY429" /LENGTH=115 /DNA_ID=CAMNT_0019283343 /DNA_START=1547 /DNA_END=1894 /DNA_ORIENTATION=+